MADGTLEPIQKAVEARRQGRTPTASQLAACEKNRWNRKGLEFNDVSCWNAYKESCNHVGSQNYPLAAEVGLANWDFVVALCHLESEQGDFGMERGSSSDYYYGLPFSSKVTAFMALSILGRKKDAEIIHKSILSHLAWDALAAVPVPRLRDTLTLPDRVIAATAKKQGAGLTVAVCGMRNTPVQRGDLTSQNSHSTVLQNSIDHPGSVGLTPDESRLLHLTVNGHSGAAREVAAWMIGTIDSPSKRWEFHLTRTTLGAQSHMAGLLWPNPMKPCVAGCIVTNDGHWRVIQTSHRVSNWAWGHRVWIDGRINAESIMGKDGKGKLVQVSMPELIAMGGKVLWHVDVVGRKVRFYQGQP